MATLPARPRIPAGPSRHVYDVIVLGGQLSGAIAGALLSKRGYRVLLVEHDGMGPGYEHEGFVMPFAPFLAPPLKAMPAFDEVLTELGLSTVVQRALKPNAPEMQLVLPRHRVDLHHDEARRMVDLRREFGEDSERFNAAYKRASSQHEQSAAFFKEQPDLPPEGFLESFKLKRLISRHPGLAEVSAIGGHSGPEKLVAELLPFLNYVNDPKEPLARTRPMSQALVSSNRFPGGREGLRELFCRKMVDLGGDLLSRENGDGWVVEELAFEGSKLVGLKVFKSDNIYRATCMIAATDSGAVRRLVPDKKKHKDLMSALDFLALKRFLFTVSWVLPPEAIPRGMGDLLLLDTGDEELGTLLIQVTAARRVDSKLEEERERVVCAGTFIPASARDLGEEHMKKLAQRISAQLETLMPFARQHLVLESAPYLDAGGVRGSRLLPHPLFELDSEQLLGVAGLAQRTVVKNLFLASREVLPGLGLEGEVLAGVRAAKLVQDTMKKSDPLKR